MVCNHHCVGAANSYHFFMRPEPRDSYHYISCRSFAECHSQFLHAQIMGPGDSYLLQYSRNIESFWATPYSLALGATFRARQDSGLAPPPRQLVTKARLPPAAACLTQQPCSHPLVQEKLMPVTLPKLQLALSLHSTSCTTRTLQN